MSQQHVRKIPILLGLIQLTSGLVILIDTSTTVGSIVYNFPEQLKTGRHFRINNEKTSPIVTNLLSIEATTGRIVLDKKVTCDEISYPNFLKLYVDSTPNHQNGNKNKETILMVFIYGSDCPLKSEENNRLRRQLNRKEYDGIAATKDFLEKEFLNLQRESANVNSELLWSQSTEKTLGR